MFDYLYYKIHYHSLKSSYEPIINFSTPGLVTLLLFFNIMETNALLAKNDILTFYFSDKRYAIGFFLIAMAFSLTYYLLNREFFLFKFKNESEFNKKRGNILFLIYILVTVLSIFIVPFYKPGKT